MDLLVFSLILLTVALNTTAQIIMKVGIDKIGTFAFAWENFIPISLKIIVSPWIVSGMTVYSIAFGIWLMVLSRTTVSIAYPMSSLAYVTSVIAAYFLLNENISILRIVGVIIILIGVYIVARS